MLLTSTANAFEAKVIAARLQAEGLEPELRGAVDGPYPFLVGGMAGAEVWIPEDELDDARLVMLATEIDNAVGSDRSAPLEWTWAGIVSVALMSALVAMLTLGRLFAAG